MPHSNPNPNPTPGEGPPELSLADLQTAARQKEEIYGQLYLLGNDGKKTILTFDFGYKRPQKSSLLLKPTVGGEAIPVSGHQFVCKGICFVAGVPQELAAYR